jgi:hypothetical protein
MRDNPAATMNSDEVLANPLRNWIRIDSKDTDYAD